MVFGVFVICVVGVAEEVQCSCNQEIEGDPMLPWGKAHPRIAMSWTENEEQLQDS